MKRVLAISTLLTLAAIALIAPAAQASFGLEKFDVAFTNGDGSPVTQAGSHPFQMTTTVYFNLTDPTHADEQVMDFSAEQIAGFVGDATSMPRCSTSDFLAFTSGGRISQCPDSTAVGYAGTKANLITAFGAVFNLDPPPGVVTKLGFITANTPVTIEVRVKETYPYNVAAVITNVPQTLPVLASVVALWGNPADPAHDPFRGNCVTNVNQTDENGQPIPQVIKEDFPEPPSYGNCTDRPPAKPFLTLPRACTGPLLTGYATSSWEGSSAAGSVFTHDDATPPNPQGMVGCAKLGFNPSVSAQPTTRAARSPSGLDYSLDIHDEGLTSTDGLANSDIRKAVVTLPEGFTANPSLAEGLEVCTEDQFEAETPFSAPGQGPNFTPPGAGCPDASKIGSVEVETPLLDENVNGALYIAKPYENPFDSLLALYMVIKNPKLGIIIKQPMKVETDPETGRITTVADDLPQLPFSHFKLHFREGTRSPLASPPLCGSHAVESVLTPWAGGPPVTTNSTFSIVSGPDAGPCPSGGVPPFSPDLTAGTINNVAGGFSPFNVRLSRTDSEQEITHFSIKLPPGVAGKLAGIPALQRRPDRPGDRPHRAARR